MKKIFGALFALPFLFATPAFSAILWAGGEDTGIVAVGSVGVSTNGGDFNASYARAALVVGNTTSTSDPPANRITTLPATFAAGAQTNLWIHATFRPSVTTQTANEQALLVRSPDGVSRIVVRQTGTAGTLKVSSRNAAGSF